MDVNREEMFNSNRYRIPIFFEPMTSFRGRIERQRERESALSSLRPLISERNCLRGLLQIAQRTY